MWPAKPKPDPELLALFEESARNVQRVPLLLRDLLTDYPEQSGARARDPALRAGGRPDRARHPLPPRGQRPPPRGARRRRRARARRRARRHRRLRRGGGRPARPLRRRGADGAGAGDRRRARRLRRAASRPRCAACAAAPTLAAHLVEIHRLENEGDRLQRAAVAALFAERHRPDDADPLEGHLRHARGTPSTRARRSRTCSRGSRSSARTAERSADRDDGSARSPTRRVQSRRREDDPARPARAARSGPGTCAGRGPAHERRGGRAA